MLERTIRVRGVRVNRRRSIANLGEIEVEKLPAQAIFGGSWPPRLNQRRVSEVKPCQEQEVGIY